MCAARCTWRWPDEAPQGNQVSSANRLAIRHAADPLAATACWCLLIIPCSRRIPRRQRTPQLHSATASLQLPVEDAPESGQRGRRRMIHCVFHRVVFTLVTGKPPHHEHATLFVDSKVPTSCASSAETTASWWLVYAPLVPLPCTTSRLPGRLASHPPPSGSIQPTDTWL